MTDLTPEQRAELHRLWRDAEEAADGDSNDTEIAAWQELAFRALDALGIEGDHPEPAEIEADPWSADPVTPARGGH